jgi:hypothetical protein
MRLSNREAVVVTGEDETPDIEDLGSAFVTQFYSNITSPHYQFVLTYGHTGQTMRFLYRSVRPA